MLSDLKFALRQLAKSRGFTLVAIVTLALGIGLNISMFSLMNLLVLQPLPYPDRDQLVRIYRTTPQSQTADHTAGDYLDIAREAQSFADVASYRLWGYTLEQPGRPPVNLNAVRVSGNFFQVLGQQPELGRFFTADEDRPGNHVLILSHATWQAQFGGDPGVIGRTVRINDEPTTIVGVLPASFASVFLWGPGDAFKPLGLTDREKLDRDNTGIQLLARLHAGLALPQFNARLAALAKRLAPLRPPARSDDGLRAVTLQSTATNASTRAIAGLLLGLAASVLLIACGNLANLQLARAVARIQEFAIRAALGATRSRLLRPLLCESLLLALAGGGFGVLVAAWSNAWISSRLSANGVVSFQLVINWRVLAFAVAVSALTGVAFGIVPAWVMSRVRVNDTLKSATRGNTGDRAQHRFRHALIITQVALALVLLAGAGMFIRGLRRLLALDPGWDRHGLLQCVLNLPQSKYADPRHTYSFYTQLQERLGALPGVQHVAVAWTLPVFQYLTARSYVVEGRPPPAPGHEAVAGVNGVSPSYLATLGVKLVAGRIFTAADGLTTPSVVIINESMARALFPNENPLGHRIGGLDPSHRDWAEIVGVVPDLRFAISVVPNTTPFVVLRPLAQETWNYVSVAVRAANAAALAEPMRRVIGELDPGLPVQQLTTMDELVSRNSGGFGMVNTILVVFAGLGLLLATLGLYGVIARLVVQRTPEIGVRVALGAQAWDVVWLILRAGLRLTLIGTVLGVLGAAGMARVLTSVSPGMSLLDPVAIAGATLLLVAIALLACWLPARRAARVDPVTALRSE